MKAFIILKTFSLKNVFQVLTVLDLSGGKNVLLITFLQYQDDINELNEIAKHRPRSTLVLGIAQENRQIRELQQENRELRLSLEEHQQALALIMQKYREQIMKLIQSNKQEKTIAHRKDQSQVKLYLQTNNER